MKEELLTVALAGCLITLILLFTAGCDDIEAREPAPTTTISFDVEVVG